MSSNFVDDALGIETPKAPKPVKDPTAAPTTDEASADQIATDRLKFRKGRASTRFGSGLGTGKTAGYKLLGGAQ
jgi:hypothetical protein